MCTRLKNGPFEKILQETVFVVGDECTMSHRDHFEAFNRTLQDLQSNTKLMEVITIVFAGALRQTLPIIPRGTGADVIHSYLEASNIWNFVQKVN